MNLTTGRCTAAALPSAEEASTAVPSPYPRGRGTADMPFPRSTRYFSRRPFPGITFHLPDRFPLTASGLALVTPLILWAVLHGRRILPRMEARPVHRMSDRLIVCPVLRGQKCLPQTPRPDHRSEIIPAPTNLTAADGCPLSKSDGRRFSRKTAFVLVSNVLAL